MNAQVPLDEALTAILGVVVRYYGDEVAAEVGEYLKGAPKALLEILIRHPAAHDSQWDPTVNPQP